MSTSGSGWRVSKRTQTTSTIAASAKRPSTRAEPQPQLLPSLTPSRSEARPTESSPAPDQSIFLLSLRTGDSGTKRRVITTANAMTIAATQKIHS